MLCRQPSPRLLAPSAQSGAAGEAVGEAIWGAAGEAAVDAGGEEVGEAICGAVGEAVGEANVAQPSVARSTKPSLRQQSATQWREPLVA